MGWHDWQQLDAPPDGRAALIAAASWAAGHVDLVATTSWPPPGERRTRAIWHRTLDNAGSSKKGWGPWQPVVSEADMSASSERDATIFGVSLATWGSRRLDLMLPDYRHFWFDGRWHRNVPPNLPVTTSENGAGGIFIASQGRGTLDLLHAGSWEPSPGHWSGFATHGWWDPASGWAGMRPSYEAFASRTPLEVIGAASWAPGRIDVFGQASHRLLHAWYERYWRGHEDLGPEVRDFTATAAGPGRLHLFAQDPRHETGRPAWMLWDGSAGGWTDWIDLNLAGPSPVGRLAAAAAGRNRVDLLGLLGTEIVHTWWSA